MVSCTLRRGGLSLLAITLHLLVVGSVAAPSSPPPTVSLIPMDGHDTTIALGTAKELSPLQVTFSLLDLVVSIVVAVTAPEFDYWGNVQEEVEALVGKWVDTHSMHQVAAYERDLETLMFRYLEAPKESSTYADKNQQAAALSMSMISHRYLVTSGDLRFSLILHFEDLASQHVAVLKDAAETYSTPAKPSQWWVDVDSQLVDYLDYLTTAQQEFTAFRMGQIECYEKYHDCSKTARKTCYDIFTVSDGVTGDSSECKQVAGGAECVDHCQTYRGHRQREIDEFVAAKVTPVREAWETLQAYAHSLAPSASRYYTPERYD